LIFKVHKFLYGRLLPLLAPSATKPTYTRDTSSITGYKARYWQEVPTKRLYSPNHRKLHLTNMNITRFIKVFSPTDAQLDSLKINFKFALKLTLTL